MTRIRSDNNMDQLVYVYQNGSKGVTVEITNSKDQNYTHAHLSKSQFAQYVSKCQELLASIGD